MTPSIFGHIGQMVISTPFYLSSLSSQKNDHSLRHGPIYDHMTNKTGNGLPLRVGGLSEVTR